MTSRHIATWATLLLVAAHTTGCKKHPGVVPVSGVVTIDGQAVPCGQINVYPSGHRPSIGAIGEDGSFTLSCFERGDGVLLGQHLATVTAVEQLSERENRWHAPKRYANKLGSELWITVDGPTDDLKLELTWEGDEHSGPFVDRF